MGVGKKSGPQLTLRPKFLPLKNAASRLALARFETRVLLIDEIDTALAAHDLAVLIARLRGLERIADFHRLIFRKSAGLSAAK
jgi:hypothetical protein